MTEILTDAEHRYSGIPTIRREMEAYGLPEPVFENRRNEFVVILYNQPNSGTAAGQTAGEAKDLLAFCQTPRTRREIADYLGISTAYYAMQHYVLPLVAEGKLALTLPDRPSSRNQRYIYRAIKSCRVQQGRCPRCTRQFRIVLQQLCCDHSGHQGGRCQGVFAWRFMCLADQESACDVVAG